VIQRAAEKLGVYNIVGVNWWEDEAILIFCDLFPGVVEGLLASFADADPSVDNMDRIEAAMSNIPSGSSYQNIVLFSQNVLHDDFRQFNYGERQNEHYYGRIEPPRVPLQNFNIPVALFQGNSDKIADELDV
jgi:hypothetical protein